MSGYSDNTGCQKINSLMVSTVLMAPALTGSLSHRFGITKGANAYVLLLLFILFVLRLLINKKSKEQYRINVFSGLFIVAVTILYIITALSKPGQFNYSFIHILFYAITPILCINLNFKTEYVLRYSLYMSLITMLGGEKWFEYQYEFMNQANMGNIYPLVTMIIITFFHYRYYRTNQGKLIKICYIYNLYILVRVVMVANRGALLTLLFGVFVVFLYSFNANGTMKTIRSKLLFILIISVVIIWAVINNLPTVLTWLEGIFIKLFNFVPSTIIKMQKYIEFDDIWNGRGEINKVLYEAIAESPLYGHGICTFAHYTKGRYLFPHNFILQYLFEGGILFAFVPIYISVRSLISTVFGTEKNKSKYIMMAMLTCQCFPKLLLSSDAWRGTAVWMMMSYYAILLSSKYYKKTNLKQKEKKYIIKKDKAAERI